MLRVPDLVPTDLLEVQVKVCVALRAKLISEVKVNIGKLKVSQCCSIIVAVLCEPCKQKSKISVDLQRMYRCISGYMQNNVSRHTQLVLSKVKGMAG